MQVAVFPQSSVANQVRVTLYVPLHVPCVVTSLNVIVTLASHASSAVAIPKFGVAGQEIKFEISGQTIVGGVTSCTTMVRLHVELLPQSSVAVHVRVTLYVPAHDPCVVTSVNVMVTVASQASVAVGAVKTGTDGQLIGVVCVAQVIVGAVLSRTTIAPLQVAVFPQSSVAVHVRVTLYVPAHDPLSLIHI